jgi:ribose 5-phosphate isomerase B
LTVARGFDHAGFPAPDITRADPATRFTEQDRHQRRPAKLDGIEREFLRDDI